MKKIHIVAVAILLGIIGVGSTMAVRIWRAQRRTAVATAAVPPVPDLRRWPEELSRLLRQVSANVAHNPDPVAPLGELAKIYLINGFASQAAGVLDGLRKMDPKNPRWPYLSADLWMRSGETQKAEAEFETTVRLEPGYAVGWLRLGSLMAEQKRMDDAARCFRRAVSIAPADLRAQLNLMVFEAARGKIEASLKELIGLTEVNPQIAELHETLEKFYRQSGDESHAQREKHLAAEAGRHIGTEDPWLDEMALQCFDADRLVLYAFKFSREGRMQEAEQVLRHATRDVPHDARLWEALADVCQKTNRLADARATLEQAVVACPSEPRLVLLLTRALGREGRTADAVATMRRAVVQWPDRADLRDALGNALRNDGADSEAVATLRDALRLNPLLPETHYDLAFTLLKTGKTDEALSEAQKALSLRPDYIEALVLAAGIAVNAGNVIIAEPLIDRLRTLQPDESGTHLLIGALYVVRGVDAEDAGDLTQAAQVFREGLKVAPDFPPLIKHAASLAFRRAQWQEAVSLWQIYIRLVPADPAGSPSLAAALQALDQGAGLQH